jgi:hypothetical protein
MYESGADLKNELEVIEKVAKWSRCDYKKLPISYHMDFALLRDGFVKALVEVKARTCAHTKYGTCIVHFDKVMNARRYIAAGVECYLAVKYTDGLFLADFKEFASQDLQWGGRDDRNDPNDQTIVAHMPMGSLKRIWVQ